MGIKIKMKDGNIENWNSRDNAKGVTLKSPYKFRNHHEAKLYVYKTIQLILHAKRRILEHNKEKVETCHRYQAYPIQDAAAR